MQETERTELIRHLFAVVTGLLEDAAALAAEGQGGKSATPTHIAAVEALTGKTLIILQALKAFAAPR